ncbi:hypothetical protein FACS1894190_11570 [Spirochaetia bacterium]|nr:hypothetical protein FACS1894190_11570 [Spirochaetia bacterium]
MNKSQVRQYVKNSFQRKMKSDIVYSKFNIIVHEVKIIKSGRNSYNGTINILVNSEPDTVSVDIKVNGRDCDWTETPYKYSFLIKYGLKNLGELGKDIGKSLKDFGKELLNSLNE